MRAQVEPEDPADLERLLSTAEPGYEAGAERYFLGEEDVTDSLSSREVSDFTSRIATIGVVRDRVNLVLRRWCADRDCVVEGRDIGTVVFPDADLKVYLTASLETRAQRRRLEYEGKGKPQNLDAVMEDLRSRDERDGSRTLAPMKAAPDSIKVDSTGKTVDEVVQEIAAAFPRSQPKPARENNCHVL